MVFAGGRSSRANDKCRVAPARVRQFSAQLPNSCAMRRVVAGSARIPGPNFVFSISGIAIPSAASLAISIFIRGITSAIVGALGVSLVAMALGVWGSGRWVRRAVADLRKAGRVAWPVFAQSDSDLRHRPGLVEADEMGTMVTVKTATVRLNGSDIANLSVQRASSSRAVAFWPRYRLAEQ